MLQLIHLRKNFNGPYTFEGKLKDINPKVQDKGELIKDADHKPSIPSINDKQTKDMESKISIVVEKLVNCNVKNVTNTIESENSDLVKFNVKKFLEFITNVLFKKYDTQENENDINLNNIYVKNKNVLNGDKATSNIDTTQIDVILGKMITYFEKEDIDKDVLLLEPLHKIIKSKAPLFGLREIGQLIQ